MGKRDTRQVLCFGKSFLKIARNFFDIRKIQTVGSVFDVYFNARKPNFHFGRRPFEVNFGSLGINVTLLDRGLDK